jgi:hypothetical protein
MVNLLYSIGCRHPIVLLLLQVLPEAGLLCRVVTYVVARHIGEDFAFCSLHVRFW